MPIANIFSQEGVIETIDRIQNLQSDTKALWGKMDVAQMLAHLNVAYDMDHTDKYSKPGGFASFMLKLFVKKGVVGPKPYPKNGRTAPQFIIENEKDFEFEKTQLIQNLKKTLAIGAEKYEGRASHSFGPLTTKEWNMLYAKHIDHHLKQFGV